MVQSFQNLLKRKKQKFRYDFTFQKKSLPKGKIFKTSKNQNSFDVIKLRVLLAVSHA